MLKSDFSRPDQLPIPQTRFQAQFHQWNNKPYFFVTLKITNDEVFIACGREKGLPMIMIAFFLH